MRLSFFNGASVGLFYASVGTIVSRRATKHYAAVPAAIADRQACVKIDRNDRALPEPVTAQLHLFHGDSLSFGPSLPSTPGFAPATS